MAAYRCYLRPACWCPTLSLSPYSHRIGHSLPLHPLHFITPLYITRRFYGLYDYDLHIYVEDIFIINSWHQVPPEHSSLGVDSVPLETLEEDYLNPTAPSLPETFERASAPRHE